MNRAIAERLTGLRLTGFNHAYTEQLTHEGFREMSFDDRMSLLIDREELDRANRAIASRVGRAKFKKSAAYEDLKPSPAQGLDRTMIQALGSCDFIRQKQNVIVTGPSGSGKTFLTTALAHRACLHGFTARYYRAPELLVDLDGARQDGRFRRAVSQLGKFQVLIIDDFMLSSISESEQKDLFELIEERHESSATILTSQNPVSLWHGLMPNPAIADAILDRITSAAVRVELKGESKRRAKGTAVDPIAGDQA
jgi:DNA replication protein DnaC